ncbi:MAG: hypothetical protein NTW59_03510 [Candidatus Diapherotrites archaeon]|nr:hypothetical protein [Candidatus Diapherotrites archaeon]
MAKASGAIEIFSRAIGATLDLRFFLLPILTIAFGMIAVFGAMVLCIPFAVMALFSIDFLPGLAAAALLGIIVFIAVIVVASAVISGFYYKSVQEYLKKKKFSIEKNFSFALKKWKTLTAVSLLQALVWMVLVVFFIALLVGLVAGYAGASGILESAELGATPMEVLAAAMPIVGIVGGVVLLGVIASILLNTLVFLWRPAAVFGNRPALQCVSDGYALGKKNFWRNTGALFLLLVLSGAVMGIQFLDPTVIISLALSAWLSLAEAVLVVKIYNEG